MRRRPHRVRRPRRAAESRILPALLLLLTAITLPFLIRSTPKVPLPQALTEAALSQVGRVGYFWGGKSLRLGPDPRWGMLARVTSAGSDTTGTLLPYGLDCSGLVTWAAVNAAGTAGAEALIGDGVRDQFSKCTSVPWQEARVGDLAFFPDLSHVGIVAGRDGDGRLHVVHSSKTLGGVVLSEDAALIGFTDIGRPGLYKRFTGFSD